MQGYWIGNQLKNVEKSKEACTSQKPNMSHEEIVDEIDRKDIERHLRYLTKEPHSAGTLRNYQLALYIKNKWEKEYGIPSKLIRYNVLLSFPSKEKQSGGYLINSNGKVKFTTQTREKPVEISEENDNALPSFAAYSISGNVTVSTKTPQNYSIHFLYQADLIYVNYGTDLDFDYLRRNDLSCEGKIVIVRYGKNFRGDKVRMASENGAIGVMVYNDPAEFAPVSDTYPHSKYLPCTGVQRGAFRMGIGDPETHGYPSIDGIYRTSRGQENLSAIPVYPISACDAFHFISKLKETVATPKSWKGGLNTTYNIGPGFQKTYQHWKVRLEVHNEESRENIYNVVGLIRGKYELDRYVIIGNHRDAWIFGGVDPSGGTACLIEIGKALGKAMKKGWRPRRSILLASWGGEEYGMIGSTEYVEEFAQILREESVAYLNIDSPVRGNYSLYAKSSPMLYDVLYSAAKKVNNPSNERETIYDQWIRNLPSGNNNDPRIGDIAAGSDYMSFNQHLGVPSAEIRYVASKVNFGYPTYHSLHDTFHYVTTFVDPHFYIHRAVAKVMARTALALADNELLPMKASKYGEKLQRGLNDFKRKYGFVLKKNNITLVYLREAIKSFIASAKALDERIRNASKKRVLTKRMLNDKLMTLEKGFVSNNKVFGRLHTRHVIFGLNNKNSYKTEIFPGLCEALVQERKSNETRRRIEEQMNTITTHIYGAANYLKVFY
ncbi:putative N-acetylated-alpha-linked acidic dipeptidase [Xenia sp. Carnegie-2017]|uniref:putative N-acetylated-alpha-linked acidic dipeptidase n=1 Tax=Xenia sp. Carnegie-2017 TaxID=2897299 RepID=UPI001F037A5B|nr:putative N-acetylated-alpha-linked acidic dipeptidase [Xenia sp. Carnegie-2017]